MKKIIILFFVLLTFLLVACESDSSDSSDVNYTCEETFENMKKIGVDQMELDIFPDDCEDGFYPQDMINCMATSKTVSEYNNCW